jgi:hypothetical protein
MLSKVIETINSLKFTGHGELELKIPLDTRVRIDRGVNIQWRGYELPELIKMSQMILLESKTFDVEQTINFMTRDGRIRTSVYENGIPNKKKLHFTRKIVVTNPIWFSSEDMAPYKLKIADELDIPEFDAAECTSARIKVRASIKYKRWRLDITLVKNASDISNTSSLVAQRDKMIMKNNSDFINKAPWGIADNIEFELEFIDKLTTFDTEDLLFVDSLPFMCRKKMASFYLLSNVETKNEEIHIKEGSGVDVPANTNLENHILSSAIDYQRILYNISQYILRDAHKYINNPDRPLSLRAISNQAIECDRNKFVNKVLPNIEDYYITDKVDGLRTIIYINQDAAYSINNTELNILGKGTEDGVLICDTEHYNDAYYIFDVIVYKGHKLEVPFEERLTYFSKVSKSYPFIKIKPFIKISANTWNTSFRELHETKKDYNTDGFILTPRYVIDQPKKYSKYNRSTQYIADQYKDMVIYKVKPGELLTIDFYVRAAPRELLGIKPYYNIANKILYFLFCGISPKLIELSMQEIPKYYINLFGEGYLREDTMLKPHQFMAPDYKYTYLYWGDEKLNLDGKICEFKIYAGAKEGVAFLDDIDERIMTGKNIWEFMRIRADKSADLAKKIDFGNYYKVSEAIWFNWHSPIKIDDLLSGKIAEEQYFKEHDNPQYAALRAYNSFVKSKLFNNIRGATNAMDIGCGKGQDIFRYQNFGVAHLFGLEFDILALQELMDRKAQLYQQSMRNIKLHQTSIDIKVINVDMNDSYKDIINKISNMHYGLEMRQYDIIICNLAFHYFATSKKATTNICSFIASFLKEEGRLIITAFDSEKVLQLLGDAKIWSVPLDNYSKESCKNDVKENASNMENYKYYIELLPKKKREYSRIRLKLPFSGGSLYEEHLVNFDEVEALLYKKSIYLEAKESFASFMNHYRSDPTKNMSEDDIKFMSLYHYYIFYRTGKKMRDIKM